MSIYMAGLMPVGQDRYGEKWDVRDVIRTCANDILCGQHISRRAKNMTTDYQKAEAIAEDAIVMFEKTHKRLIKAQEDVGESAKKGSAKVRVAANDLADGLKRIEKQADFSKLERYVALLERAATAMQQLAELEKSGRLEKIAAALK